MKKILTSIAFCLMCMFLSAQELAFKGILFSVGSDKFLTELQSKGFKLIDSDKNEYCTIYTLKGNFAGKSDCEIYINTSLDNRVGKLSVYFPEKVEWYSLKNEYFSLKDIFTEKYGKPSGTHQTFFSPYYEGDGYEMQAVRLDKIYYMSEWKIGDDYVYIEITKYKSVRVSYECTEVMDKIASDKNNSIIEDI